MTDWTEQDISEFQKIYLKYYLKKINKTEAKIRLNALVELLALTIEIENTQKQTKGNLSEPD